MESFTALLQKPKISHSSIFMKVLNVVWYYTYSYHCVGMNAGNVCIQNNIQDDKSRS
jgi:hypothetical protein